MPLRKGNTLKPRHEPTFDFQDAGQHPMACHLSAAVRSTKQFQ